MSESTARYGELSAGNLSNLANLESAHGLNVDQMLANRAKAKATPLTDRGRRDAFVQAATAHAQAAEQHATAMSAIRPRPVGNMPRANLYDNSALN